MANALPDRADFAAPAIAVQLRNVTESSLQRVLQNGDFQKTVNSTIGGAHDTFIDFVRQYEGDGTIDVSGTFNALVSKLDGTRLSFLGNVKLPQSVGSVVLVNASWLPAAHTITNNVGSYRIMTALVFGIASVLAVVAAHNKRRTVLWLGAAVVGIMLVTLIALRLGQHSLIGTVDSQFRAAAQSVSEILLAPLVTQTWTILFSGVLVVLVAWLSGPYKAARVVRERSQLLLGGRAHEAIFGTRSNQFTRWLGQYKAIVQWVSIGLAGFLIVMLPASLATTIWTVSATLLVIIAVEIVAVNPKRRTTTARQVKPKQRKPRSQ